jgi:hypothetical protein
MIMTILGSYGGSTWQMLNQIESPDRGVEFLVALCIVLVAAPLITMGASTAMVYVLKALRFIPVVERRVRQ